MIPNIVRPGLNLLPIGHRKDRHFLDAGVQTEVYGNHLANTLPKSPRSGLNGKTATSKTQQGEEHSGQEKGSKESGDQVSR